MMATVAARRIATGCVRATSLTSSVRTGRNSAIGKSAWRAFTTTSLRFEKKYSEDHEWVELDAAGKIATVGLSEYAARLLGDVVFVELPEEGQTVAAGDAMGSVESTKSVSEIYAPVSGKVVERNGEVIDEPSMINESPEGKAWAVKLELGKDGKDEVAKLMTAAQYQDHTSKAED